MDKFPSIPHLPFSPQIHDDDIKLPKEIASFCGRKVCIFEKLDGGNCCIYKGNVFSRSHKQPTKHAWFNTIKDMVRCNLLFFEKPYFELMIFGENMTAIHSITYKKLTSYFYIFAIFDPSKNVWFSVDDVLSVSHKLNVPNAPILFRGCFDSLQQIKKWMDANINNGSEQREGFVIRIDEGFEMKKFDQFIAKYVRKGHIQTECSSKWIKNWQKTKLIQTETETKTKTKHKQKQKKPTLKTSMIVCCGLPGSGKSTFSAHLCSHRREWERAGTDLFGKKKGAVLDFVGRMSKNKNKKCIVENCNVSVAKRRQILSCAFYPKDAICVFFDVDKAVCGERVRARQNHETAQLFKSKKGQKIIDSFFKQLEVPNVSEGFSQILTMRNVDDCNALLSRLGVSEPLSFEKKEKENEKNENENNQIDQYCALMAKENNFMNAEIVCSKLQLSMNDILCIYVIGSRVWGNAKNEKSDWDFVIVTKTKNEKKFVCIDEIDAYILTESEWENELNNHNFYCLLTRFIPNEAIWRQKCSTSKLEQFEYKKFVNALQKEIEKDCKKMKKYYSKNKMKKMKKTFVHCLRMAKIAKKIITLLQAQNIMNDSKWFDQNLFVGMIEFEQIENEITNKQMEIEKDKKMKIHILNAYIDELQNELKQCKNII